MDLTSEELRMLAGYYLTSDDPGLARDHFDADLDKHLETKKIAAIPLAVDSNRNPTLPYPIIKSRAYRINKILQARGLLTANMSHENQSRISISIDGLDIGRKYSHFWGRADLWYQSHKEGLLGLIWSVIGGFFGAFIYHLLGLHN